MKPHSDKSHPASQRDDHASPHEIERRVKRLTSVATELFRRGSYAPAFDSLMQAYLLDPSSPHVLACEKTLRPALDIMQQRGSFLSADLTGSGGQRIQLAQVLSRKTGAATSRPEEARTPETDKNSPLTDPAAILQQQRIEALKERHELAKKEREKEMWRKASSPPTVHSTEPPPPPDDNPKEPQKAPGGLLSRLRQGKFFS